jgi:hypothetical protein
VGGAVGGVVAGDNLADGSSEVQARGWGWAQLKIGHREFVICDLRPTTTFDNQ